MFDNTIELEQSIIYGLLTNPSKISQVFSIITPDDFQDDLNRKIAQAILDLSKNNITPDFVSIITKYPEAKSILLDVLEYPIFLTTEKHLMERANLLKQENIKSEIQEIYLNNFDPQVIREKISQLEAKGLSRWFSKEDIFAIIDQMFQNTENYVIPYPFNILNKATRGISKGQYIIVAGRPSIGKSTFLDNIAEHTKTWQKSLVRLSRDVS